jgi:type II secretory pathway pseudopilin PulG
VAVVLGLGVIVSGHVRRAAREAKTMADLERIRTGIEEFLSRTGALPASLADVEWAAGGRLSLNSSNAPVDPWGSCYVYAVNGARAYVLYSTGEDSGPTNSFDDIYPGVD